MEQFFLTGIDVNELLEKIEHLIDKKLSNFHPTQELSQVKYITRIEVAELLKISLPTLHDWSKNGILQSYKIGKRVLYKAMEIEEAIKKVSSIKHKRGIV